MTNETETARYLRAWKEELPESHVSLRQLIILGAGITRLTSCLPFQWFPMEYYPQQGGVRGHEYHVFNTVRCLSLLESPADSAHHFPRQPLYYKFPEGAVL